MHIVKSIYSSIDPMVSLTDEMSVLCDLLEVSMFNKSGFFAEEVRIRDYTGLVNKGVLICLKIHG